MINYKIFEKAIKILDDVLLEELGPNTGLDFEMATSTGDSLTVILTTDSSTGTTEEMFINVIAGTDSGGS